MEGLSKWKTVLFFERSELAQDGQGETCKDCPSQVDRNKRKELVCTESEKDSNSAGDGKELVDKGELGAAFLLVPDDYGRQPGYK